MKKKSLIPHLFGFTNYISWNITKKIYIYVYIIYTYRYKYNVTEKHIIRNTKNRQMV